MESSEIQEVSNCPRNVDVGIGPFVKSVERRVAAHLTSIIPHKAETFSEDNAPNDTPDAHPSENCDSFLRHWVNGEGFATKPCAQE